MQVPGSGRNFRNFPWCGYWGNSHIERGDDSFPWSLNWCLGKVVLTLRKPLWAEWKAPLGWRAKLLNLPELWSCCTWSCPSLFGSLSCSPRPVCPFLSYFTVWAVAQYAGGHERGGEALGGNRVGTGLLSSLLPHGQRYSCRQWGGVFELDGNHSESQHGSIASLETFLDMFLSGDCGKGHGIFSLWISTPEHWVWWFWSLSLGWSWGSPGTLYKWKKWLHLLLGKVKHLQSHFIYVKLGAVEWLFGWCSQTLKMHNSAEAVSWGSWISCYLKLRKCNPPLSHKL